MLFPFQVAPISHPPPHASMRMFPLLLPNSYQISLHWHRAFTGSRASSPTDARQCHPLLIWGWGHVYSLVGGLVPGSSGRRDSVGWHCCSSYGVTNPFSSFSPFSSSSIGDPVLSPMVGCEHPPLYLSGFGRASQETAISSSCQKALLGICHSVLCGFGVCMWDAPGEAISGWPFLQSQLHNLSSSIF